MQKECSAYYLIERIRSKAPHAGFSIRLKQALLALWRVSNRILEREGNIAYYPSPVSEPTVLMDVPTVFPATCMGAVITLVQPVHSIAKITAQ